MPPTLEARFHFITTLLGSKKALSKTAKSRDSCAQWRVHTHKAVNAGGTLPVTAATDTVTTFILEWRGSGHKG